MESNAIEKKMAYITSKKSTAYSSGPKRVASAGQAQGSAIELIIADGKSADISKLLPASLSELVVIKQGEEAITAISHAVRSKKYKERTSIDYT